MKKSSDKANQKIEDKKLETEKAIIENEIILEKTIIEEDNSKHEPISKLKLILNTTISVLVIIILTSAILLQHPTTKTKFIDFVLSLEKTNKISLLEAKINEIDTKIIENEDKTNKLADISEKIIQLNNRFNFLEENNLNIINSKADVALMLGIIQRADEIEKKLATISQVSNQGALIVTATMLVKDASETSDNYLYEFSVLKELAKNENAIQKEISVLEKYAKDKIYNTDNLIQDFIDIYMLSKLQNEEDITEKDSNFAKFNDKFGKIVKLKIKKKSEDKENKDIKEEVSLNIPAQMVADGDIYLAVKELEQEKYNEIIKENPSLETWLYRINSKLEFNNAISKISAYSLGIMRANNLK